MTTSHESSASLGAGDQPGEKAQALGASAEANDATGARQTAHDTPISASAQNPAEHTRAPLNGATRPVDNGSDNDESADDLDDEEIDDYDEYEESESPAWLSTLLSFLHWPPSRRAIY